MTDSPTDGDPRPPVPLDVADLTSEWFTAVFVDRGWEVDGVEVLDAHSGTTGRARVALRGRGDVPMSVFVKLAPFDPQQREFIRFTGIGVAEARCYESVGDDLPVRTPRAWYVDVDVADDRFVMVLEDLVASGCRFPERSEADDTGRARSTVEELAALHAAFWESPRFGADLTWIPAQPGFGDLDRASAAAASGAYIRDAYERFVDEMPAAFAAVGNLYATRTAEIFDLWDAGPRTLVHGDCHIGNLFVDRHRTGFYDWALVSHAPGPRDVAYTCCYSMDPPARRSLETDLLHLYASTLAERGVDLAPDRLLEQYRLFSVFAWVSATATAAMGTKWQSEELSYRAMERATVAIDDLDAVGLLREQLG